MTIQERTLEIAEGAVADVRLASGEKARGFMGPASAVGFTLKVAPGTDRDLAFSAVTSVHAPSHVARYIAIGVGIGALAAGVIAVVAAARHGVLVCRQLEGSGRIALVLYVAEDVVLGPGCGSPRPLPRNLESPPFSGYWEKEGR